MKHVRLAALAAAVLPAALSAQAPAPAAAKGTSLRYLVAPTGNEARYRVREQLVGKDLPNDVIGVTKDVTGQLVVQPDGKVVSGSKISVKVASLASDQTRRDNYLRRRTLETDKYPTVDVVPTTFTGISSPIPAGQSRDFSLTANMTIHGVTRPTTWQVTARAEGKDVVGTAKTSFTFKDFSLEQPKVPIVLSVADTVRLEYDFRFTQQP
ncbi:YceI family protein [Roseisolibacter sp. H3M3-2]|uniref:YceI family protein n=1 Tax=Roseisolibacter sp. H3M3-2 TaxID=3031323 RepID=UPI0023DC730A|nr:YceI family protein [Roseisolibacter sp. H3M3-2]MDF1504035.1 YceI family protein [Roseisolibacter sp. H3M3-2]